MTILIIDLFEPVYIYHQKRPASSICQKTFTGFLEIQAVQ